MRYAQYNLLTSDKASNTTYCPPALHTIHVVMDIYNTFKAHGGIAVNRTG